METGKNNPGNNRFMAIMIVVAALALLSSILSLVLVTRLNDRDRAATLDQGESAAETMLIIGEEGAALSDALEAEPEPQTDPEPVPQQELWEDLEIANAPEPAAPAAPAPAAAPKPAVQPAQAGSGAGTETLDDAIAFGGNKKDPPAFRISGPDSSEFDSTRRMVEPRESSSSSSSGRTLSSSGSSSTVSYYTGSGGSSGGGSSSSTSTSSPRPGGSGYGSAW